MEPVNIYQWVNDHNPSPELSYRKGWWDYITFLYLLDDVYGKDKTTIVSTYDMKTPPPQEILLMPVARLETGKASFIMKTSFDGIGPDWTVSVIRDQAERLPLYSLIDEHEELSPTGIDGFAAEWVFPSYAKSSSRFTGRVDDDWNLYTLIWVITHS
jgi:hypothetical protein